jgi:hypothetical protein
MKKGKKEIPLTEARVREFIEEVVKRICKHSPKKRKSPKDSGGSGIFMYASPFVNSTRGDETIRAMYGAPFPSYQQKRKKMVDITMRKGKKTK